jgi:hypothetical protein
MAVKPRELLPYLDTDVGVEISACTGNARRVSLAKLLACETVKEFIAYRVLWGSNLAVMDAYFRALSSGNVTKMKDLYENSSEKQRELYDIALTESLTALKSTRVRGNHLRAMWALGGKGYLVNFKLADHQWARLLTDTETTCSLVVINQKCLQCPDEPYVHAPQVPVGLPSVLEIKLVLNPMAKLPPSMRGLLRGGQFLAEKIGNYVQLGDQFDIRDHGRIEVVAPPEETEGIFVELVQTWLPTMETMKRKFGKVLRLDFEDRVHWECRGSEDKKYYGENIIPLFLISSRRQLAYWWPLKMGRRRSLLP